MSLLLVTILLSLSFSKHVIDDPSPNTGHTINAADLDNDGDLDVIAAFWKNTSIPTPMVVYWNEGGALVWTEQYFTADSEYISANVGDFDNDGDLDIVASCNLGPHLLWFGNLGSRNFSRYVIDPLPIEYLHGMDVVDFNGDGRLDIIVPGSALNTYIYFNQGGGVFTTYDVGAWPYVQSAKSGHLDADTLLDIVLITSDSFGVTISWNNWPSLTPVVIDGVHYDTWYPDVADIDLDGRMDIVTPDVAWYRNLGGRTFSYNSVYHYSEHLTAWTGGAARAADMDMDGDLDIVAQLGNYPVSPDTVPGYLDWYENDGAQNFTRNIIDTTHRVICSELQVVDLNGDGCLDILANGSEEVVWYEGLCPLNTEERPPSTHPPRITLRNAHQALLLIPSAPTHVSLYDVSGRLVKSLYVERETKVALKAGVYFVKPQGGKSLKTVVR